MSGERVTYKEAGVDIDAGHRSVEKIRAHVESTFTPAVVAGVGAFGGLFDLSEILKEYKKPVLVQSMDGVGTKLMVATMAGDHSTIGKDIVNHCCDDIVCQGAKAITFLDYVAMSKLSPDKMEQVVSGMAKACRDANVALIGGETAELPGIYRDNEYDVVGLATGVVERDGMITGQTISGGNVLVGLSSSGLHTNGYTLARKVFFDIAKLTLDDKPEGFSRNVGQTLLEPHVNYASAVLDFLKEEKIHGIAHITGGGMKDNVERMLPDGTRAVIKRGTWPVLPVFEFIRETGNVAQDEMERSFNMGIGLILAVEESAVKMAIDFFTLRGHPAHRIGEIVKGKKGVVIQ